MIIIKAASITDIPLLRDIGIQTYTEHFSAIWSPSGMQRFLERDFSPQALKDTLGRPAEHCWLIAFDADERAVGFAKINWNQPIPDSRETGAELQKIYFLQSQAGKGHGQYLLEHSCEQAKARQQPWVWLEVLKTNKSAQRFYQRAGFERRTEVPYSTDIAAIPLVVMALHL